MARRRPVASIICATRAVTPSPKPKARSSLSRAKGQKEDTILDWLRDVAKHIEALEEKLLASYRLKHDQLDGLWARMAKRVERPPTRKRPQADGLSLQVVKQRKNGRVVRTIWRIVWGGKAEVLAQLARAQPTSNIPISACGSSMVAQGAKRWLFPSS